MRSIVGDQNWNAFPLQNRLASFKFRPVSLQIRNGDKTEDMLAALHCGHNEFAQLAAGEEVLFITIDRVAFRLQLPADPFHPRGVRVRVTYEEIWGWVIHNISS